jgi:hypothetical protein
MAIVKRRGSIYYYRNVRVKGKVKRIYVASGEEALLAAAIDSHRRLRKRIDFEARQAEIARWNSACQAADAMIAITNLLVAASLLSSGYRQHYRGLWRLKHERHQREQG